MTLSLCCGCCQRERARQRASLGITLDPDTMAEDSSDSLLRYTDTNALGITLHAHVHGRDAHVLHSLVVRALPPRTCTFLNELPPLCDCVRLVVESCRGGHGVERLEKAMAERSGWAATVTDGKTGTMRLLNGRKLEGVELSEACTARSSSAVMVHVGLALSRLLLYVTT